MSDLPPEMPPDQQESRSIRYGDLIAIALLSSGNWAIYTTERVDRDSFQNKVLIVDKLDLAQLQSLGEAQRAQRAIEDAEYEERRALLDGGPAVTIAAEKNLEDMGL